jgi:hypothetical protein
VLRWRRNLLIGKNWGISICKCTISFLKFDFRKDVFTSGTGRIDREYRNIMKLIEGLETPSVYIRIRKDFDE